MRVLFLLTDGRERRCDGLIEVVSREHEVTVVDLSGGEVPYERIVDEVFANDRVIAW